MLHSRHLLSHFSLPLPKPTLPLLSFRSTSLHFLRRLHPSSSFRATSTSPHSRLAELPTEVPSEVPPPPQPEEEGPVELPSSSRSSIFAQDDNPSPLQVATSLLLTGSISVFLFRALRRRAKRAKELKLRSSGLSNSKDPKEVALDNLKAMGATTIDPGKPPSPVQAFLGSIAAGVICLILYKFATTVEASFSRQAISDNFSVRQITITIRTIVNGLCYLATFVFGINSVGLMLYALQLAFGSNSDNDTDSTKSTLKKDDEQLNTVPPSESSANNMVSTNSDLKQTSDNSTDSSQ
ncbi:Bidirectional sugar transporter SWEET4 [Rhynchospora pubera]|uniref:Bidirectional sugar transporter SWEET4 n=1 Tax=Rhynchospora pubera TaxID=906938 RepID=A0AAV8ESN6_9POAL|nr:Bidirectional sugar transporter SWEET4 [Rhynchospora pubera]